MYLRKLFKPIKHPTAYFKDYLYRSIAFTVLTFITNNISSLGHTNIDIYKLRTWIVIIMLCYNIFVIFRVALNKVKINSTIKLLIVAGSAFYFYCYYENIRLIIQKIF